MQADKFRTYSTPCLNIFYPGSDDNSYGSESDDWCCAPFEHSEARHELECGAYETENVCTGGELDASNLFEQQKEGETRPKNMAVMDNPSLAVAENDDMRDFAGWHNIDLMVVFETYVQRPIAST